MLGMKLPALDELLLQCRAPRDRQMADQPLSHHALDRDEVRVSALVTPPEIGEQILDEQIRRMRPAAVRIEYRAQLAFIPCPRHVRASLALLRLDDHWIAEPADEVLPGIAVRRGRYGPKARDRKPRCTQASCNAGNGESTMTASRWRCRAAPTRCIAGPLLRPGTSWCCPSRRGPGMTQDDGHRTVEPRRSLCPILDW